MTGKPKYEAHQMDGRPETDPIERMWSVVDTDTDQIVASYRETPITGMTFKDAEELAAAWNKQAGRD